MADQEQIIEALEVSPEVEADARHLGWSPKSEWRGDPAKWTDAQTFLDRGRNLLPVLRENNTRLQSEVSRLQNEVVEARRLIEAGQESVSELMKFHEENIQRAVKTEREAIKARIREAREEGNIDAELAAQDELTELAARPPAAPKPPPAPPAAPAPAPAVNPAMVAWQERNDWFGKDTRKTALAVGIAQELREKDPKETLTGKAFFDKVDEELASFLAPKSSAPNIDRLEGGSRSSGGQGAPAKKSYASLPADAKTVCDQQAKKLVGPGRAFKDEAAWRSHYAEQYFRGE